jgi:hypothetical protein
VAGSNGWAFDLPVAYDSCEGTNVLITVASTTTNFINSCLTVYQRTWTISDLCGNSTNCAQIVSNTNCPPSPCPDDNTNATKYIQPPNLNGGYDIWNQPNALADDFVCTNTGPITDIHLWGSWALDKALTNNLTFYIGILSDVPVSATNSYSHPGNLLWSNVFYPGQYVESFWGLGNETFEVLDAPGLPFNEWGPESNVWYYCFYPANPFVQIGSVTNPVTYWLAVHEALPISASNYDSGLKTTTIVQHDVSVWSQWINTNFPGPSSTWYRSSIGVGGTTNFISYVDLAFKLNTLTNWSGHCPTNLTIHYTTTGTNIVLTWTNGILQSATAVLGPYGDVPGATSPYTTNYAGSMKFFRLRCLQYY